MNPVLASPWPSALGFLAEGLSADRALRLAIDGSSCRKAIAVGGGLDGPSQPSQFRRDDGWAGLDVWERLQPGPHPDRRSAGIVPDREHEALQALQLESPPGPSNVKAGPPSR